ncbi:MAG TPA: UDP-2,3-diacylglucosamine hydrolase, partial [Sulfurospirillum sp. UBA11407]
KFGNLNYINFSSFACNQSYFIVEFFNGVKFTQKKLRGFDV